MNALRMGSLFAGYEGLGLGVSQVLDVELAWVSEYEPPTEKNPNPSQAAAKILAHHYPHVPNHGDITAIDWSAAEPVDVLTAGYPCQPFSDAGLRLGETDERYLWPEVERAIRHLGPRLVVLENVAGHVNRGFPEVLGSLASIGYDARWTCLQAAHVGAPHRRERLFAIAWPAADAGGERRIGWPGVERPGRVTAERLEAGGDVGDKGRAHALADPDGHPVREQPVTVGRRSGAAEPGQLGADASSHTTSDRRHEGWPEPTGFVGRPDAALGGATPADADGDGLEILGWPEAVGHHPDGRDRAGQETAWGPYEPAIRRWERALGRVAPPPTEPGRTGAERLSPRFVEWMQGLDDGWVTGVPGISRNDQLKALGNGVVPQQAAEAMRRLILAHDEAVTAA